MYPRIGRTVAAIALLACGILVSNAATGTAYATDPYSQALLNSQDDIADSLVAIGWPTADTGNYDFYPGALNHPDNGTSVIWGTPGSPTTYHGETKCAPFLTQSLTHSYTWATSSYFTTNFGSTSPSSAQYYDALSAGTAQHFDSVAHVQDLQAGDVIVIKFTDHPASGATGHTMTVKSVQTYNRDANPDTTEYAIQVIDSTDNPHGLVRSTAPYVNFPDTRATTSNTTEYSGIGKGWIFIQVDSAGVPVGYWWGVNENVTTEFYTVAVRPITMARLTEAL
jgi:hypothetical protein